MNTLQLSTPNQDGSGWDLVLDSSENLAIQTGGNALAQDAASAVRTFQSECWYDATLGVPYYGQVLGQRFSLQLLKQLLISAASIVPGVASVACFLTGPGSNRVIGGQLQITSTTGQIVPVTTANLLGQLPSWVNAAASASGAIT